MQDNISSELANNGLVGAQLVGHVLLGNMAGNSMVVRSGCTYVYLYISEQSQASTSPTQGLAGVWLQEAFLTENRHLQQSESTMYYAQPLGLT